MKQERLTHAQRREQTRERLLVAARNMFVNKGLAATSVENIAGAAGYTRGAFYSNFDGKPELLLELLRRDHGSAQANLQAIMEEGGTIGQMEARAVAYCCRYFRDHDCFPLWVEAKLLACRDTEFRESFNALWHERLEQVGACIRAFSKRDDGSLPQRVDALALGLVRLCDGIQFVRMCDPQMVSDEMMQSALTDFLSSVLSCQAEEVPRADNRAGVSDRGQGSAVATAGADEIRDHGSLR